MLQEHLWTRKKIERFRSHEFPINVFDDKVNGAAFDDKHVDKWILALKTKLNDVENIKIKKQII